MSPLMGVDLPLDDVGFFNVSSLDMSLVPLQGIPEADFIASFLNAPFIVDGENTQTTVTVSSPGLRFFYSYPEWSMKGPVIADGVKYYLDVTTDTTTRLTEGGIWCDGSWKRLINYSCSKADGCLPACNGEASISSAALPVHLSIWQRQRLNGQVVHVQFSAGKSPVGQIGLVLASTQRPFPTPFTQTLQTDNLDQKSGVVMRRKVRLDRMSSILCTTSVSIASRIPSRDFFLVFSNQLRSGV